ncbi:flagellar hook-basal body complex protein FliE [Burkholderia oklahomensis]|uniref:flagellar hook-basal body complex protein FliE n=1 Tax=Burkholderia oklahomensis TaxID=342113 RepID=UPI00264C6DB1|nr:flagellar hook-basal body complex protein FliE [Burkholderia oklahomensis]MDN7675503.1 flagellar hook-basal body complex protein FliE [Burkholderia oklahomensis]
MEPIEQVAAELRSQMAELGRQASAAVLPAAERGRVADDVNFASVFSRAVDDVDSKQTFSAEKMSDVDSGRSDDLIGAMLASQEASLSFSMLTQVRNKLTAAMDDLLKMQI